MRRQDWPFSYPQPNHNGLGDIRFGPLAVSGETEHNLNEWASRHPVWAALAVAGVVFLAAKLLSGKKLRA